MGRFCSKSRINRQFVKGRNLHYLCKRRRQFLPREPSNEGKQGILPRNKEFSRKLSLKFCCCRCCQNAINLLKNFWRAPLSIYTSLNIQLVCTYHCDRFNYEIGNSVLKCSSTIFTAEEWLEHVLSKQI